jgi:DNA-binding transcriptional LysR family regulator
MDLLDKMTTYVRVVEAGSFSAAAKQQRISSAAVSRQIATLEAELRQTLLWRSTRRMAVTAAGDRYYQSCLRVLREVDDAQALGTDQPVEGFLQVSTPVTFGLARVVPHVHSLMTKHPRLRVDLRLEDRLIDLTLEGVDVAIRVGTMLPKRTDLVAHRLFSFRRVMVASPDYVKRKGEPSDPEALVQHQTLSYPVGTPADIWILSRDGQELRVRLNVAFRCNALHALRDLAVAGGGIALLPDWLVADEVRRCTLRLVLPDWQTEAVQVNALHRTKVRGAPRVRAFVDHLREAYSA